MRDAEGIQLALTRPRRDTCAVDPACSSAVQSCLANVDVFRPVSRSRRAPCLLNRCGLVVSQRLYPRAGGGRLLAAEVLIATPAVRNLIREAKTHQLFSLLQTSSQQGMCTFEQHLQQLSMQGVRVAGAK